MVMLDYGGHGDCSFRHSREGGNPGNLEKGLDSRLRGNEGLGLLDTSRAYPSKQCMFDAGDKGGSEEWLLLSSIQHPGGCPRTVISSDSEKSCLS
jgi:hypothetical protein